MTNRDLRQVTNDPDLNARLCAMQEDRGQDELEEYVASLGLRPPGHKEGEPLPAVYATWLPGMSYDEPGIMVWATEDDESDPGDGIDETETGWGDSAGWMPPDRHDDSDGGR
jgi:hypothetical protein